MECPVCGHSSTHKHGKAPNGSQRYFCPLCKQTFNEQFDTLYYHRQVTPEQIRQVLQAHSEGSSLRGISRTTGLAYNTVVSIVRAASQQAQLVHNAQVHGYCQLNGINPKIGTHQRGYGTYLISASRYRYIGHTRSTR